jgi:predicted RNA-binding Zn-ribbon protein involved in translation (DUF1610 family)
MRMVQNAILLGKKITCKSFIMTIQILHYEFLGPIRLDEWGPPMEKVVYLILSRQKDTFNIIYAGECEKTNEKNFFTNNPNFKRWIQTTGSENSVYLAILPLFDSPPSTRLTVLNKIILRYKPSCNPQEEEKQPGYIVHKNVDLDQKPIGDNDQKISCPCCGSEMRLEKQLQNSKLIRCTNCGLSDTRMNS